MSEFKYVGSELDLFATMGNWKSYWSQQIQPFILGDVAEVGAGIGSNTRYLDAGGEGRWVCLEPDPQLTAQLVANCGARTNGRSYEAVCGTLQTLAGQQFDTIVYIDVLEHIENDREELIDAASHLRAGGHLIVLCPAHQRLFTPFDAAIGHFRRYNKAMMRSVAPPQLRLKRLIYLDSVGMAASGANLLLLRQSMPTKTQLNFWNQWLVPTSRVLDKLLFYSFGKTIVGVWSKDG